MLIRRFSNSLVKLSQILTSEFEKRLIIIEQIELHFDSRSATENEDYSTSKIEPKPEIADILIFPRSHYYIIIVLFVFVKKVIIVIISSAR